MTNSIKTPIESNLLLPIEPRSPSNCVRFANRGEILDAIAAQAKAIHNKYS